MSIVSNLSTTRRNYVPDRLSFYGTFMCWDQMLFTGEEMSSQVRNKDGNEGRASRHGAPDKNDDRRVVLGSAKEDLQRGKRL